MILYESVTLPICIIDLDTDKVFSLASVIDSRIKAGVPTYDCIFILKILRLYSQNGQYDQTSFFNRVHGIFHFNMSRIPGNER
jgi:hypothetical protein